MTKERKKKKNTAPNQLSLTWEERIPKQIQLFMTVASIVEGELWGDNYMRYLFIQYLQFVENLVICDTVLDFLEKSRKGESSSVSYENSENLYF